MWGEHVVNVGTSGCRYWRKWYTVEVWSEVLLERNCTHTRLVVRCTRWNGLNNSELAQWTSANQCTKWWTIWSDELATVEMMLNTVWSVIRIDPKNQNISCQKTNSYHHTKSKHASSVCVYGSCQWKQGGNIDIDDPIVACEYATQCSDNREEDTRSAWVIMLRRLRPRTGRRASEMQVLDSKNWCRRTTIENEDEKNISVVTIILN